MFGADGICERNDDEKRCGSEGEIMTDSAMDSKQNKVASSGCKR